MKHHLLGLLKIFLVILDVFSAFVVDEQKTLPEVWRTELQHLGGEIEQRQAQMRAADEAAKVAPEAA